MNRALGAKFFKFGMVVGMGMLVSKKHRKQVVVDLWRPSCVKFKMAVSGKISVHFFAHNQAKKLCVSSVFI